MTDDEITQHLAAKRAEYDRLFSTRPLSLEDIPPTAAQFERHIILSDYHHRTYTFRNWITGNTEVRHAHDPKALAVVEAFMQKWEPTHIHYAGDFVDFHVISRFCKKAPPEDELPDSLAAVRQIIRRHRMAYPNAWLGFYLGNHEVRWQNFIEEYAAPLAAFAELSYSSILAAKELRLNVYPYKQRVTVIPGKLEITHGDRVRGKSGLTAHAMLEKGISGVSGHTHRLGMVYRTNRAGMAVWAENGCLCRTDPEYLEDPDWQQGCSIVYVDRENGRFHMEQLPILQTGSDGRRIVHAGQVFEA